MSSPITPSGGPSSTQEFPDRPAGAELSITVESYLLTLLRRPECQSKSWIPASIGQELLDAGLVARTLHQDGRTTYRLTAAGRAWRAA